MSSRELAEEIYRVEQLALSTSTFPQLGSSSTESEIEFTNSDGKVVARLGAGDDGVGLKVLDTAPPPKPSTPIVSWDAGVINVRWDGRWADPTVESVNDGDVKPTRDISVIQVFASTDPNFVPNPTEHISTSIPVPPSGGSSAVLAGMDTGGVWYVVLVARSTSGKFSVPSDRAAVQVDVVGLYDDLWRTQIAADGAIKTADSKHTVRGYGGTPPTVGVKDGDLFFDDDYKPYHFDEYSGEWVGITDARITALQDAEAELRKSIDSVKVSGSGAIVNYSPSKPGPGKNGDLWFDTTPGEGGEPQFILHIFRDGEWVSASDSRLATLKAAQDDLARDISDVRVSADGKATVYRQPAKPGEGSVGDLWFDTSSSGNNEAHVFDGSNWVSVADKRVATLDAALKQSESEWASALETVRVSADGKSTIHWSTGDATGVGKSGDTWFKLSGSQIVGYWSHDGSRWVQRTLSPVVIPNLDAGKITSGFIDAARIKAKSLNADVVLVPGSAGSTVIRDGAVTTGKVAADAITAKHIAANSVDLGSATFGSLDGSKIKANTVTADKLLIGSGSNLLATEFWKLGKIPGRPLYEGEAIAIDDAPGVRVRFKPGVKHTHMDVFSFRRMSSTGADAAHGDFFSVKPGEQYRFSCFLFLAGVYENNAYVNAQFRAHTYDAQQQGLKSQYSQAGEPAWSGTPFTFTFTVPDGHQWLQLWVSIPNQREGWLDVAYPRLEVMTDSTLIQDGAITTGKIAAGAITAESGVVGSLDAGKITVGEMDGVRVKANTITADKLLIGSGNLLPDLGAGIQAKNITPWRHWEVNDQDPSFWAHGNEQKSQFLEHVFEVRAGVRYRFSVDVKSTKPGVVFYWQLTDIKGAVVNLVDPSGGAGTSGVYPFDKQATTKGNVFQTFTSEGTASRTALCRVRIWPNHRLGAVNDPKGYMWFRNARIEPMTGATLIEDGAVTTGKLAANSVTADHLTAGSVDLGKAVFGEMDGARIKARTIGADLLKVGAIDGQVITGATVQTRTTHPKTVLDSRGFHITDTDGADVVNLTADPSAGGNYLGILAKDGSTLANISNLGLISGEGLDVPEITVGGDPLLGSFANYESPTYNPSPSWFDRLPWGLVAWGRDNMGARGLGSGGGRLAFLELAFDVIKGRNYRVTVEFPPVDVPAKEWLDYQVQFTLGTARVDLDSPVLHKIPISNPGDGSKRDKRVTSFVYPCNSASGQMSILASIQSGGPAKVVDGYSCLIWVEDCGPLVEPTTNPRRDVVALNKSAPAPPPKPAVRNYTKVYRPTNGTAFYVGTGNKRTEDRQYFYQGHQPGTNKDMRSMLMFPNMTGDLSGTKITSIRVHYEFKHWYYSSGGTAKLWFHNRLTTPDKLDNNAFKRLMTKTKVPRPGSVTVDVPASWWNEFKTGALRGIGFGGTNGGSPASGKSAGYIEYGYGEWKKCWIEVKYQK